MFMNPGETILPRTFIISAFPGVAKSWSSDIAVMRSFSIKTEAFGRTRIDWVVSSKVKTVPSFRTLDIVVVYSEYNQLLMVLATLYIDGLYRPRDPTVGVRCPRHHCRAKLYRHRKKRVAYKCRINRISI